MGLTNRLYTVALEHTDTVHSNVPPCVHARCFMKVIRCQCMLQIFISRVSFELSNTVRLPKYLVTLTVLNYIRFVTP